MGLIVDINVLTRAERNRATVDFTPWAAHGEVYISAVTCSELLVGVHLANTPERHDRHTPRVSRFDRQLC